MTLSKTVCAMFLALLLGQISAEAETVRDHRRILGGLNLQHYCTTNHGSGAKAVNRNNTSGGWRCQLGRRTPWRISFELACRQQYGRNNLLAEVRSSDDSWVCIDPRPR